VKFRNDKAGIVHCTIGKANFSVDALKDNLSALLADLVKAKPSSAKGVFLQKVSLSTTMGVGVTVDQATWASSSNRFTAALRARRSAEVRATDFIGTLLRAPHGANRAGAVKDRRRPNGLPGERRKRLFQRRKLPVGSLRP
jgi:hypothetical protein